MNIATRAHDMAQSLLREPLPRRWAHTQGVARRAELLAPILGDDAELLRAAAFLHDIGYAPKLAVTGFHPLDGARYLRDHACEQGELARLVAHHSCALLEAEERGLRLQLEAEFPLPEQPVMVDALIYCDMTTTPHGEPTSIEERLAEIRVRYDPESVVGRFIRRAAPQLRAAADRVAERLAQAT